MRLCEQPQQLAPVYLLATEVPAHARNQNQSQTKVRPESDQSQISVRPEAHQSQTRVIQIHITESDQSQTIAILDLGQSRTRAKRDCQSRETHMN